MKKIIMVLFALVALNVSAQSYEADIFRFSTENYSGTPRFVATGGAFASVGSDLSNLSYNPGGIGMYRSSLFLASLGVASYGTNSMYYDSQTQANKVSALMPSLGIVFSTKKASKNGLFRNTSFAFAMNRLGSYAAQEDISHFNTNPYSSISWSYANEMNSVYGSTDILNNATLDDLSFDTYNAYFGYLVNYDSTYLAYTSPVIDSFQQNRYNTITGGKNEMVFGIGTNYIDKLYFGASIGVPIVNQIISSTFTEENSENVQANTFFNDFTVSKNDKTEALGFNLKLGAIYKINEWVRIGGAFHTPEKLHVEQFYSSSWNSSLSFGSYSFDPIDGQFSYKMRLPWKATVGASLFFKDKGFLSVDYNPVAYNSMRYIFDSEYTSIANSYNAILKNKYKMAHDVRVGVEGVIKKFRIRAGYNYNPSPIKKEYQVAGYNFNSHVFSGGFGFVLNKIAIDFAYQHRYTKQFEQPYTVTNIDVSGIQKTKNTGVGSVSFAYRFR